ncbi:MAG: ABC transporter ATP-binding protein [Verrucomicrobia bacterium]|nr:ABC transporter ATP-binding protein [Verrucomicrobiota bacterium]
MSAPAIRVEGVSKRFVLSGRGSRTLKSAAMDLVRFRGRGAAREFWALRDIAFEVSAGETLGIIGANGAGKSTLLSLLAGTRPPTTGRITTRGTISSLLELGAGFHPELTGRENVYLAGAVMGIPRRAMRERFDAIVAFAGIDQFIDQPVKHYSSGMYVRLGFAVAVEVNPDILLIDEVLAVGDIAFQRKCIEKMDEFRRRGKTMLIISHDLETIQSISDRILLLAGGRLTGLGKPETVVEQYRTTVRAEQAAAMRRDWGSGEVTISGVTVRNAKGAATDTFQQGDTIHVEIAFDAHQRVEDPVFGFAVSNQAGVKLYGNNTQIEGHHVATIDGKGSVRLALGPNTLGPGHYMLSFSTHSADHKVNFHRIDNGFPIVIEGDRPFEGCYMPVRWGA